MDTGKVWPKTKGEFMDQNFNHQHPGKNYKPIYVALSVLALTATVIFWLSKPHLSPLPVQVAIVLDLSDSVEPDKDCQILSALILKGFNIKGIRKNSKMFISGTGNPATAFEPVSFAAFDLPISDKVMEGREAVIRVKKDLLFNLTSECRKNQVMTRNSPIFLAVKRAVEQLQANGCLGTVECYLFVRTDGEETEEPWLKQSLKAGKMLKKEKPALINNTGIRVSFCGFSETRGEVMEKNKKKKLTQKRAARSAEFLNHLWKEVFTEPDNVVIMPLCPKESRFTNHNSI